MAEPPLLRLFPALASLPRVPLLGAPTRVERMALAGGAELFVKRDDLCAKPVGGNKARALEWLLGALREDERVLTVGPRGSTHALTTAVYARRLGAATTVVRWNQHMNDTARRVDARLRGVTRVIDARSPVVAYGVAAVLRWRPGTRWIPAGGATPLGVLGHVNAAIELADQIAAGELPVPDRVVVPFGSGGTAAGLALGFRIAGVRTRVVAVRVVPRALGRRARVLALANRTARLIERVTGLTQPRLRADDVVVEHGFYGGAYGRPLTAVNEHERALGALGVGVDDTYSRKAFAAATCGSHRSLFWLTFDPRLLQDSAS